VHKPLPIILLALAVVSKLAPKIVNVFAVAGTTNGQPVKAAELPPVQALTVVLVVTAIAVITGALANASDAALVEVDPVAVVTVTAIVPCPLGCDFNVQVNVVVPKTWGGVAHKLLLTTAVVSKLVPVIVMKTLPRLEQPVQTELVAAIAVVGKGQAAVVPSVKVSTILVIVGRAEIQ